MTDPLNLKWALNGAGATDALNTKTLAEAKTFCTDAGMRLPSRNEALNLYNYGDFAIESDLNGYPSSIWSVDGYEVSFTSGGTLKKNEGEKLAVRCVQGDPTEVTHNVEDKGDYVVDHTTGLEWSKFKTAKTVNYSLNRFPIDESNSSKPSAAEFCTSLDIGGKTDWKLPSINDLRSIVCLKGNKLMVPSALNPAEDVTWVWSATEDQSGNNHYILKVNEGGRVSVEPKTGKYFVTCVRKSGSN